MTGWSMATTWCQLRTAPIIIFALLIPFTTAAAAPEAALSGIEKKTAGQQLAAYHTSPTIQSFRTHPVLQKREVRGRIAEARRILMELQAFIEETARTVELDSRLKIGRRENDRLRTTLSSSLAAKTTSKHQASPMEELRFVLTRTVVRNWLETVRLNHRSDEAERELINSKKSWSSVEKRATALRQTLIARRAELRSLRTASATLRHELNHMRRQVTRANAETHLLEQQQVQIIAATETLRRNVTSKLRKALLENEH